VPASLGQSYPLFLGALFILACGVVIIQVVANPLICALGPADTAHSRLTFAQAFQALGTTVFPYVGALLLLRSAAESTRASSTAVASLTAIGQTYLWIAVLLLCTAVLLWTQRHQLAVESEACRSHNASLAVLREAGLSFGALAIFIYVGAEVAIGSVVASYLMQADTLGLPAGRAGEAVAIYWGGALLGRFVGAWALRHIAPATALVITAVGALGLVGLAATSAGPIAGVALVAVGLCNAIMFPTIFSLACRGLGPRTPEGSGILCMAIVGGACVPLLVGWVADCSSLRLALLLPAACYLGIALFGRYCAKRPALERTVLRPICSDCASLHGRTRAQRGNTELAQP
jgi:FHS family L-fucose permease-like MFS transporter